MHSAVYLSLISFLLLLCIQNSLSCSCLFSHPQKAFCDSDLAFRFKVLAKDFVDSNFKLIEKESTAEPLDGNGTRPVLLPFPSFDRQVRYTVRDFVIYKGLFHFYKVDKRHIFTASDGAACGVYLEVGKRYAFIGGSISSNRLSINSCQNRFDLDAISARERRPVLYNLAVLYKKGCWYCKVRVCGGFRGNCEEDAPRNVCQTDDLGRGIAQRQNAVCVPVHSIYRCAWYDKGNIILPKPQVVRSTTTTDSPLIEVVTTPELE